MAKKQLLVHSHIHAHTEQGGKYGAHQYGSLLQDARGDGSKLLSFELNDDENGDDKYEAKEQSPDFGAFPWVDRSAPLQSQEETGDTANQKYSAQHIDLCDLLPTSEAVGFTMGRLEEGEYCQERDRTKGKVDPETPDTSH